MPGSGRQRSLRIACYGVVGRDAGSAPSANYLLLRELTRRGVAVDLFAWPEQVPPPVGLSADRFRHLGFPPPFTERGIQSLPGPLRTVLETLAVPIVERGWHRVFDRAAASIHREDPYDAVLALGATSRVAVRGVPVVTWPQGPLTSELDAIKRLRREITSTSGWPFYVALVARYRYIEPFRRRALASSSRIIVGSEWSRERMVGEGFDRARIDVVPYPIDLDHFHPAGESAEHEPPRLELLALGRLDPRKRLDLLLEAFRLVLCECPEATLRIVGRTGYAPPQLSLIEESPVRDRIRYQPQVPRKDVPPLLRNSAALVQASENENFGSSVAEALACGTPVVVGSTNGTAQYVDRNSQVFERYEPDAVAQAIIGAIRARNEEPADVLQSTRASAEEWFSVARVADQVIEIIDKAISRACLR